MGSLCQPSLIAHSLTLFLAILPLFAGAEDLDYWDLESELHGYWDKEPTDPFTPLIEELESGKMDLSYESEEAWVESLLEALEIPPSSQTLVFSTTSLQLSRISPRNPRAVYFKDELYIGWVPGGQIEVVTIDPTVGGIFYIFDIPERPGQSINLERSDRCMNCHANLSTGKVPGPVIKSVMPSPRGGSLDSFRRNETGHGIPYEERFGGWHLTGEHGLKKHWGNKLGSLTEDGLETEEIPFGERFNIDRYPVPTSDILAHILFEHQNGFTNRVIEATYRTRTYLDDGNGRFRPEHLEIMREQAEELTRYILFADEAELPKGGIKGDPRLMEEFREQRKEVGGKSLRDFDLEDRIFKHRCSYMIYSQAFQQMHPGFRKLVYTQMDKALSGQDPDYRYLRPEERTAIREILRGTLEDLPEGW